jgi:hypothetical protein
VNNLYIKQVIRKEITEITTEQAFPQIYKEAQQRWKYSRLWTSVNASKQ